MGIQAMESYCWVRVCSLSGNAEDKTPVIDVRFNERTSSMGAIYAHDSYSNVPQVHSAS
jgi:hypothetical protein